MGRVFRVEVDIPATKTKAAHTLKLTHDGGVVIMVENELSLEEATPKPQLGAAAPKAYNKRVSHLTVRVRDREWVLFNDIPDPSFARIKARFFMAPSDRVTDVPVKVFEGIVTRLAARFPAPETLDIVIHDESVRARKVKRHRVFQGKNSQQIAESISKEYGWTIDADVGNAELSSRAVSYGIEQSDWEHLRIALAADGLSVFLVGNQLKIRQSKGREYPVTFKRGEPPVIGFEISINHIVDDGNAKGVLPGQDAVTEKAAVQPTSAHGQQAKAAGSSQITHKSPVGGTDLANLATPKQERKDDATLTLQPTPDITQDHRIMISGFGVRGDGKWFVESVKHVLVPGDSGSSTTLSLHRHPKVTSADAAAAVKGLPGQL